MNRIASSLFLSVSLIASAAAQTRVQIHPEEMVHPLVGTEKEGQTYPAVGVPFGMTHWTPQTRAGEIKCVSPYYYTDPKIQGFRGSHFLSGSCVPDYGTVTLMPGMGQVVTSAAERASSFERSSEHPSPYSYTVDLKEAHTRAEITGTRRAGIMRFTLQQAGDAWMVAENNARGGDGTIQIDATKQEITAEVPVRREYAGSGKLAGFSGYFVIQFNQPFKVGGAWEGKQMHAGALTQSGDGMAPGVVRVAAVNNPAGGSSLAAQTMPTASNRPGFGVWVSFPGVKNGTVLLARIGTSFVSVEEARKNLQAEIPAWSFDKVREEARSAWNKALSAITIHDDIPARTVFYTSLYHALLHPRTYSDVSGSYPRFHSNHQVEHIHGSVYYDDFSMWDTFRAAHPLYTILDPERDGEMMQSLVLKGKQGGFLPIFPAWNSYTSEMVGDHSTVTMIDAWRKGIRNFDMDAAYPIMRKNATEMPANHDEYIDGKGRRAVDSYQKYGYIPLEDHIDDAFHNNEQVSRTLEYAFDDAILGSFAKEQGKTEDAELFTKHGQNWRNVIDPETGFARGRHADGTWLSPFDPTKAYTWITEGLPFQYTFFVPQDVPGLIEKEGGNAAFVARLDTLFEKGYYNHGNEPSHHIAYLYDAAGAPAKAQQHIRALLDSEYKDFPAGLAGNDDSGQMSAWYVLSALGFYQVTPGIPEYWIGSPRFDHATIRLPGGRSLSVEAPGAGAGKVYVRKALLNGKEISGYKIAHKDLVAGGVLKFEMSNTPAQ